MGFDADGKRLRRKVSGQTKAEVKDKLKALHSELDAGVRTVQGYTVEAAVADWPAAGAGGNGPAPRGAAPRGPAMPGVIPPSSITTIIGTAFFSAIRLSRM